MREFDLPGFAAFLGELAMMKIAEHSALDAAAVLIQDEAKRVIGTYEYAWPELAASTKQQRRYLNFSENDPLLRNGTLRDAIEHTTHASEAEIGVPDKTVGDGSKRDPIRNIGDVAAAQELGTSRIPARSFLLSAAVHKEQDVVELIGRTMVAHLSGQALPKP